MSYKVQYWDDATEGNPKPKRHETEYSFTKETVTELMGRIKYLGWDNVRVVGVG